MPYYCSFVKSLTYVRLLVGMKMPGSIVSNRTIIAVSPPTNEAAAVGTHEVNHLQVLICDCQDQAQPPNLKPQSYH